MSSICRRPCGDAQVQAFVKLKELFYAGSHGMDIAGPQVGRRDSSEHLAFRPAARFEPIMQKVRACAVDAAPPLLCCLPLLQLHEARHWV